MGAAVVGGIGVCSLVVLTGIQNIISNRVPTAPLAAYYSIAVPYWREHLIELLIGTALVGNTSFFTWYQFKGKLFGSGGPSRDVVEQLVQLQPIAQCNTNTASIKDATTAELVQSLEKDIIYI